MDLLVADGIVGMGLDYDAIRRPTAFSSLPLTPGCLKKVFSLWFSPESDDTYGGELILCGTNEQSYSGDITYVPINNKNPSYNWQFTLDMVAVTGFEYDPVSVKAQAIVDTSTPFIVGSLDNVTNLYGQLGRDEGAIVDCKIVEVLPPLKFVIGGRIFTLLPPEYVFPGEAVTCTIGIHSFPLGYKNTWILGTSK